MTALITAVIPVGFIIAIGFIAGRMLPIEQHPLAQLTLYILAPALVANSLYQTTLSLNTTTSLVMGYAIASLLLYLVTWGLNFMFQFPPSLQKSLIATTLFSNNGNMGLPVTAFALGAGGLERAVVYMIASSVVLFGIAPALLKAKGFVFGLRLTLKLPLIWAMLAGLSLRLLSIELPFRLDTSIELLAQAAIPLALLMLGMQLATTRFEIGYTELFATSLRLLLSPLIAFTVGYVLHLQPLDLKVLVLQSAMPTAVNTFVLVSEFGGDAPWVARTIVVSTLMSFATLPTILWASSFI